MSRVGQAFLFKRSVAVVTSGPSPPRRRGSTLTDEQCELVPLPPDRQVYTLAVLHDSGGVVYPVERLEDSLKGWEEAGRLVS